jgi:hypothetical protein
MVPYELQRKQNIRERTEKFKEVFQEKDNNENLPQIQNVSIDDTLTQPHSVTRLETHCPDEVLNSAPQSGQELNLEQTEPLDVTEVNKLTERYGL